MKLYVEGGGDAAALKTACREGFAKFLGKAGLAGRMPRIVACGSRADAYDSFCTAIGNGEAAMLLVDPLGQLRLTIGLGLFSGQYSLGRLRLRHRQFHRPRQLRRRRRLELQLLVIGLDKTLKSVLQEEA